MSDVECWIHYCTRKVSCKLLCENHYLMIRNATQMNLGEGREAAVKRSLRADMVRHMPVEDVLALVGYRR